MAHEKKLKNKEKKFLNHKKEDFSEPPFCGILLKATECESIMFHMLYTRFKNLIKKYKTFFLKKKSPEPKIYHPKKQKEKISEKDQKRYDHILLRFKERYPYANGMLKIKHIQKIEKTIEKMFDKNNTEETTQKILYIGNRINKYNDITKTFLIRGFGSSELIYIAVLGGYVRTVMPLHPNMTEIWKHREMIRNKNPQHFSIPETDSARYLRISKIINEALFQEGTQTRIKSYYKKIIDLITLENIVKERAEKMDNKNQKCTLTLKHWDKSWCIEYCTKTNRILNIKLKSKSRPSNKKRGAKAVRPQSKSEIRENLILKAAEKYRKIQEEMSVVPDD